MTALINEFEGNITRSKKRRLSDSVDTFISINDANETVPSDFRQIAADQPQESLSNNEDYARKSFLTLPDHVNQGWDSSPNNEKTNKFLSRNQLLCNRKSKRKNVKNAEKSIKTCKIKKGSPYPSEEDLDNAYLKRSTFDEKSSSFRSESSSVNDDQICNKLSHKDINENIWKTSRTVLNTSYASNENCTTEEELEDSSESLDDFSPNAIRRSSDHFNQIKTDNSKEKQKQDKSKRLNCRDHLKESSFKIEKIPEFNYQEQDSPLKEQLTRHQKAFKKIHGNYSSSPEPNIPKKNIQSNKDINNKNIRKASKKILNTNKDYTNEDFTTEEFEKSLESSEDSSINGDSCSGSSSQIKADNTKPKINKGNSKKTKHESLNSKEKVSELKCQEADSLKRRPSTRHQKAIHESQANNFIEESTKENNKSDSNSSMSSVPPTEPILSSDRKVKKHSLKNSSSPKQDSKSKTIQEDMGKKKSKGSMSPKISLPRRCSKRLEQCANKSSPEIKGTPENINIKKSSKKLKRYTDVDYLGSSWDKKITPPRRFSLRLLEKSLDHENTINGTPLANTKSPQTSLTPLRRKKSTRSHNQELNGEDSSILDQKTTLNKSRGKILKKLYSKKSISSDEESSDSSVPFETESTQVLTKSGSRNSSDNTTSEISYRVTRNRKSCI